MTAEDLLLLLVAAALLRMDEDSIIIIYNDVYFFLLFLTSFVITIGAVYSLLAEEGICVDASCFSVSIQRQSVES
jgi:hypothetical protein